MRYLTLLTPHYCSWTYIQQKHVFSWHQRLEAQDKFWHRWVLLPAKVMQMITLSLGHCPVLPWGVYAWRRGGLSSVSYHRSLNLSNQGPTFMTLFYINYFYNESVSEYGYMGDWSFNTCMGKCTVNFQGSLNSIMPMFSKSQHGRSPKLELISCGF